MESELFELFEPCLRRSLRLAALAADVAIVPYSGWRFAGYNRHASTQFVSLQKNLKMLKEGLKTKRCLKEGRGVSLLVAPCNQSRDPMKSYIYASDLDFLLPNDDLLYPHWKAFATALAEYDCDYNTMFVGFASIKVDIAVLEILSPAFSVQKLTSLFFLSNDLGPDELCMISSIIDNTPTLEALSICRNRLDQKEEVVGRLISAIRNHPHIQRLTLARCGIGNNLHMLSCIRNKSLTRIDLGGNYIGPKGAYYIAKFIAKAKGRRVAKMCLENNQFGDKQAHIFASALRMNKTLTHLDLEKNSISTKGKAILIGALYDESSLNAIADSNHTCLVKLGEINVVPDNVSPAMVECLNNVKNPYFQARKNKIHTKLLTPMSSTCCVPAFRYFEDVPAELIPEVLEFVQCKAAGIVHDSRAVHTFIFEFLRGTCIATGSKKSSCSDITGKRKYNKFVDLA